MELKFRYLLVVFIWIWFKEKPKIRGFLNKYYDAYCNHLTNGAFSILGDEGIAPLPRSAVIVSLVAEYP